MKALERRRLAWWFVAPASVAAGFFHAGMWVHHFLRRDFCRDCRLKLVPLVSILTTLVLGAAAFGVAVWLAIIEGWRSGR